MGAGRQPAPPTAAARSSGDAYIVTASLHTRPADWVSPWAFALRGRCAVRAEGGDLSGEIDIKRSWERGALRRASNAAAAGRKHAARKQNRRCRKRTRRAQAPRPGARAKQPPRERNRPRASPAARRAGRTAAAGREHAAREPRGPTRKQNSRRAKGTGRAQAERAPRNC